jgi:hypothetical protein
MAISMGAVVAVLACGGSTGVTLGNGDGNVGNQGTGGSGSSGSSGSAGSSGGQGQGSSTGGSSSGGAGGETLVGSGGGSIGSGGSGGVSPADCSLPKVEGPCDAAFSAYWHNPASGMCEWFIYGGCEGNANRFDTFAACQAACGGPSPTYDVDGGTCRTDKITFTQQTGCQNDGWVELCIPSDDAASLTAVHAAWSNASCSSGSLGRVECDPATQLLCFLQVGADACVAQHGAMTDAAWQNICKVSTLDTVSKIAPGFAE